jgi:uncharacterized membrane protein
VSPMAALVLASVAFVGTHFLLSHPLRAPLAGRMGERLFQAFYSLVAAATFVPMIYFYGKVGSEAPLWPAGDALWLLASLLMWFGSILFVGSFIRNPALPGARGPKGAPTGVFRITRHPMMWGFALWAIVHMFVEAMPKALVLDGAILFLALVGAAAQDRKKQGLMGERWHEWRAQTAFTPFAKGVACPGTVAFVGGTLLFFLATWVHPIPAGFWRWIG